MRYAFHFVDEGGGWDRPDLALLQALLQFHRRNFVIHRGNVVHWDFGKSTDQIVENAVHIHSTAAATMGSEAYIDLITSTRPYVQLVKGLTRRQAARADDSLSLDRPTATQAHWASISTIRCIGRCMPLGFQ